MKLLTFGLFIAAITVQISAVEIVQEREDGEGDLESRIDVESEESRVKALDVESRILNATECPCKIYNVEVSGLPKNLNLGFSGEFKKKYSKNGDLGRRYDVIWERPGKKNVIAGLGVGVWYMGIWGRKGLSKTFIRVNTGKSTQNICPDAKKLANKWQYRTSNRGRYNIADGIRRTVQEWKKVNGKWTKKSMVLHPVIKVKCKAREDKRPRLTNTNQLSRRPRPSRQEDPFGKKRTNTAQSQKKNKCTYWWCT